MVLFDIDKTLVFGENAIQFYRQYSEILEKTLARLLQVDTITSKKIADEHRAAFDGRGELAFRTHHLDFGQWHDALTQLSPSQFLTPLPNTQALLQELKSKKYIVGAITDGPRPLVEKILGATKIDSTIFDFIIGWERGKQMPKYGSTKIFTQICMERGIPPQETVMIGDSLSSDILPAIAAGLHAIYINPNQVVEQKKYRSITNITQLSSLL